MKTLEIKSKATKNATKVASQIMQRYQMKTRSTHVAILRLALSAYALNEIEEKLAGHRLDAAWQRLIMYVL